MNSDIAFDMIENIAKASGNSKIYLLRQCNIEKYLVAAYDPYIKYHITKGKPGVGQDLFIDPTWDLLDRLSTRRLSGMTAQAFVNVVTEAMTPKSSALFHRILNKDLRMGMGAKSINKAFPGLIPTHDVMLAKLFDLKKAQYPCFGSPKIDGVRAKFKNGVFYSRGGHPYKGLDHLANQLKDIREELDGELAIPGLSFQVSSGYIRSDNQTPDANFHLLELPSIKDSYIVRMTMLRDLHLIGPNVCYTPPVELICKDEIYDFYRACRRLRYEGSVITPYDYDYVGTRSYRWMKLKPLNTFDGRVIDIYEGKGKYTYMLGGVVVMFKGKRNSVGGGFSDFQRISFWNYPSKIMGKMIEVHYMEETDKGNMRHSRFFDFREDKQ